MVTQSDNVMLRLHRLVDCWVVVCSTPHLRSLAVVSDLWPTRLNTDVGLIQQKRYWGSKNRLDDTTNFKHLFWKSKYERAIAVTTGPLRSVYK